MRYLVFISFLVATLTSAGALARDRPIRVAVSPFVYLTASSTVPADEASSAVLRGMEAWVGNVGMDFTLASVARIRDRVVAAPGYPDAVALAQLQQSLGVESYRELDPVGAAQRLGAAREQYYRVDHQLVAPQEVSETLLFHALALLDGAPGNPTAPLDVMKEMVLIDPGREVKAGAFPDEVVGFYQSARLELERDIREGGPGETLPKRVAALAAARRQNAVVAPTDYVLVGNVLATSNGGLEVIVWLYDVDKEQFQVPASLVVDAPNPQRLADAANRLTSQLLTCLVEPTAPREDAIPESSGSSPFALQIYLAYASYYRFPNVGGQVVEPFDHLGAALGGSFYLTREFALLALFQFLTSTAEFSGLVEPGFTTLRFFAGGEIGIGVGRLRFALGTLLEGAAISSITTCPGLEVEDRRVCNGSDELPSRTLFGVNARPRISFRVLNSMQIFVAGSTSFYFLPQGSNSLNFLTAGEAGLQYRF